MDNSCFIGNIHGAGVGPTNAIVFVDADGKLGTDSFADGQGGNVSLQEFLEDHRKVQQLEATVAQLTAQLKEQASEIQKVSAELEASKPAPHGREQSLNAERLGVKDWEIIADNLKQSRLELRLRLSD